MESNQFLSVRAGGLCPVASSYAAPQQMVILLSLYVCHIVAPLILPARSERFHVTSSCTAVAVAGMLKVMVWLYMKSWLPLSPPPTQRCPPWIFVNLPLGAPPSGAEVCIVRSEKVRNSRSLYTIFLVLYNGSRKVAKYTRNAHA